MAFAWDWRESINTQAPIQESLKAYRRVVQHRDERLFTEFLPRGYEMVTLSSVEASHKNRLFLAKIHLGMLITLYDDLADNPAWVNSTLLHELYKLPFHSDSIRPLRLSAREKRVVELAKHLADETFPILLRLPHFNLLGPVLRFDLQQFFNSNRYCELLTQLPFLANAAEGSNYINHNMGMMIVGTMDLMASPDLILAEIGEIRALLTRGQRFGRICNVLSTLERELEEGDVTNELVLSALQDQKCDAEEVRARQIRASQLASYRRRLSLEREAVFRAMKTQAGLIRTFDVALYLKGLRGVQKLHDSLRGVI